MRQEEQPINYAPPRHRAITADDLGTLDLPNAIELTRRNIAAMTEDELLEMAKSMRGGEKVQRFINEGQLAMFLYRWATR